MPHVLYVEKAQNFIGDFSSILSEARKYRLSLVLVTQGIEQLAPEAAFAVFSNCATIISFRVSGRDAERLKHEFATVLPASELQDMPDYKAFVRTMKVEKGVSRPSGPYVVKALTPFTKGKTDADPERVIRVSLARYAKPRAEIEAKLSQFLAA